MNVFLLCTSPDVVGRFREIFAEIGVTAEVRHCDELARAVDTPPHALEIMALGACSEEDRDAAEAVVDADGLPRWAVFHLGATPASAGHAVSLPMESDNAHLAQLITLGLENHRLRRLNLQVTGDFRSVSRRVCHDLRTPLSCIQTVLSVLEATGGAGNLPGALMDSAASSTQELARMVDELALIGRTWGQPSEPGKINVGETLDEAVESIGRRFPAQRLQIGRPSELPVAIGVLTWVEFIWEAFLTLATERLPEGHSVSVSATPEDEKRVRLVVELPGQAEAFAEVSRAFLPFHLLADQRGRGRVDLALVQRFCRLMNGACGCSVSGDALQLYFTLPVAEAE